MRNIKMALQQAGVSNVLTDEPLANHTTWRVGGLADWFIIPQNKHELQMAMRVLYQEEIPWRAIGRGSNLLVRDGGIRGAVIKVGKGLDHFEITGTQLTAGGGFSFVRLAGKALKASLAGIEFASGIPGSVGGAVFMNAGAHGSEVSKVLSSAEVLLKTGELSRMSWHDFHFRYRTTVLQKEVEGIVTEATFQLEPGDKDVIRKEITEVKDVRRKTQPLNLPCAGSVFRNPPNDHAGRLIEAAGLKGYRVGNAQVSTLHANFIVNRGQAKAADILALIHDIKHIVFEKYGVTLQPEVRVVGEG